MSISPRTIAFTTRSRRAVDGADFTRGAGLLEALEAYREIEADIAQGAGDRIYQQFSVVTVEVLSDFGARYVGSRPYRKIRDYLESDTPLLVVRNYVGAIEFSRHDTITGWAGGICRRPSSIDVDFLCQGERIVAAGRLQPNPRGSRRSRSGAERDRVFLSPRRRAGGTAGAFRVALQTHASG